MENQIGTVPARSPGEVRVPPNCVRVRAIEVLSTRDPRTTMVGTARHRPASLPWVGAGVVACRARPVPRPRPTVPVGGRRVSPPQARPLPARPLSHPPLSHLASPRPPALPSRITPPTHARAPSRPPWKNNSPRSKKYLFDGGSTDNGGSTHSLHRFLYGTSREYTMDGYTYGILTLLIIPGILGYTTPADDEYRA